METPKLGTASIFNVQPYLVENGKHADFWSFHVSEVPSNPQLTLKHSFRNCFTKIEN